MSGGPNAPQDESETQIKSLVERTTEQSEWLERVPIRLNYVQFITNRNLKWLRIEDSKWSYPISLPILWSLIKVDWALLRLRRKNCRTAVLENPYIFIIVKLGSIPHTFDDPILLTTAQFMLHVAQLLISITV